MTQLGERFREAREARGLSISEASALTRILPRYLQAIEAGDVGSLPGDVYARGFIRNYAQLLGLPAEEMIMLYRQERGEPTGRIQVVPAAVPPRTRSCLIPSFFVTFFTVLLLLAGVYFVLNWTGMLTPPRQEALNVTRTPRPPTPTMWVTPTDQPEGVTRSPLPPTPTLGTPTPGPSPTVDVLEPPTPTPPPSQATATTAPAAPVVVQARVLEAAGTQGSWFEVRVDGAPAFNALMRPAQSQQWLAQREIYLNIGDTSVVELIHNGRPVDGLPGAVRGVPRRITCTPQGCG